MTSATTPHDDEKAYFVQPITDLKAIKRIKMLLIDNPVHYALFVIGINTAFRAGDLRRLQGHHVLNLKAGDDLVLKEEKTGKQRRLTVNESVIEAIKLLPNLKPDDYLFSGQRGVFTVPTINRLVKHWCRNVGLTGNYGSHTLRKTWGYQQRVAFKQPLLLLMDAYNHASERQTLQYLCIQPAERKAIYLNAL